MEQEEDKVLEIEVTTKASERTDKKLLKELIKNVEKFITNKELRALSETLKKIFYHGLSLDSHGIPNIRRVFGVLDFLNEKSLEGRWNSFNKWLTEHINKGTLTKLLSFLISDTEHIKNCYEPAAFIRNEGLQNALMTCILAVETNQLNLLTSIDSRLYDDSLGKRLGHRRASSQPQIMFTPPALSSRKSIIKRMSRTCESEKEKVTKDRKWNSSPNLAHESYADNRPRSKTFALRSQSWKFQKKVSFRSEIDGMEATEATEAIKTEDVPYFAYRDSSAALRAGGSDLKLNVPVHVVHVEDIKIHTDYRYSPDYNKDPATSRLKVTSKKETMFSFLDQTSSSASKISSSSVQLSTSPTDIFFTVAVSGSKIHSTSPIVKSLERSGKKLKSSRQNLNFFLQTINNSSRPKVALDRENAHFHLSEAIIATFQQLKWNKILDAKYNITKDTRVKEDLLLNRKRQVAQPPPQSTKFILGSVDDECDSSSSADEMSTDRRTTSTSSDDTYANVPQMEWNVSEDPHSAESIAMILMSKFKNERLPNPNSFLWLVNESQAPQQMLPFPDSLSFPVNPDEPFHLNTFIRGSKDWAPPRQQIIFTVHPTPDRRKQCLNQLNRCAGCGMKVQVQYLHTFRYCDYLGKYFCSACHKNQISAIPARVLERWDFSLYPVSSFTYRWLDEIWNLPLFHVADLNPQLYEKAKPLMRAREARMQLKFVQDFIEQCRFAETEKGFIAEIPAHWTDDVDIWSMTDFVDTKNNVFTERIQEIIARLEEHIVKNDCELCMARGFFCEICAKNDIIFPWQNKIKRCSHCGSCYHEKCFKRECSKCERLKRRKRMLKSPAKKTFS